MPVGSRLVRNESSEGLFSISLIVVNAIAIVTSAVSSCACQRTTSLVLPAGHRDLEESSCEPQLHA